MKKHQGDPPACVDCVHYRRGDPGSICESDDCSTFNPIKGRQSIEARIARSHNGQCGLTAKFFKAKSPETWVERNRHAIFLSVVGALFVLWMLNPMLVSQIRSYF